MQRAFIFDFDGVIIHNEPTWEQYKREMFLDLFGQEIFAQMGSTIGINIDGIYARALALGAIASKEVLEREFFRRAPNVYQTAPLADGVDTIGKHLTDLGYRIGIVSASPRAWIDIALARTDLRQHVHEIISLHERHDLQHKPAPDGYKEMVRLLEASPERTLVLEDSNAGIQSGKSAGIFTIGFRGHLVQGYVQHGADAYADTFSEVLSIVKNHNEQVG